MIQLFKTFAWRFPRGTSPRLALLVASLSLPLALGACKSNDAGPAPAAPPTATYTGPQYLYNTIGSLSRLSNHLPQPVQGYGLIVDLEGTGSDEVPQSLRRWLINEMTKYGVGQSRYRDFFRASPEQLLASPDTAVVRVEGHIPGGAVAGSRFDLLVTAADTRSTSLAGGRLWTTELAAGGFNPSQLYVKPLAKGNGPVYLDPLDTDITDARKREQLQRQAVIVSGGVVTETRIMELVLNQPSRRRASDIADRINERFPAEPNARRATANAISPLVVQLNIPRRFRDAPQTFVDLVLHTYIDRSRGFVPMQAQRLADELSTDPDKASSVVLAWKALGPAAQPVFRQYYEDERSYLRLAALEAGAFVGDELASDPLAELSSHRDPAVRLRVAEALISLRSPSSRQALRSLLDDPIESVRIAAYESLALKGSELVKRTVIHDGDAVKMVIDRVMVQEPLIYITQKQVPRVVIFNPSLGFEVPTMASVWDGRLMIRRTAEGEPAELFYQHPVIEDNRRTIKAVQHKMEPTLATLAYTLAHRPTVDRPYEGFNLTYGQVVDAIYQLVQTGAVDSPIELDRGLITRLLDERNDRTPRGPDRPETAPVPGSREETAAR